MFAMFKQFFLMITSFFIAGDNLGKAAVHLSTWAEESAGSFADKARIERAIQMNDLNKLNKASVKQLNNESKAA